MKSEATVFVVDPDPRVRDSVARLLKSAGLEADIYESAEEFLDQYRPPTCGCLVVNASLQRMSGLELQEQLIARGIRLPIIFIAGNAEVPTVVQALQAGAVDFLERPFDDASFLRTVAHAIEKHEQIEQENAWRRLVEVRLATLTPREGEIMHLLVAGNHSKQISSKLKISAKTVDVHRAKVLQKMQVDGVVNLTNLIHRLNADG